MATLPRLFRPTDPLYALQWQYGLIGRLGDLSRSSTAGIERLWADVTGAGVAVALWDSGIASAPGDQAFSFIGAAPFTAVGQLRMVLSGGLGVLQGTTTNASTASFQLLFSNGALLPATQIIL